uniref:Uncharacterized protein n=1 Tax=Anguilla anguilla TaxID=7936 RepID=A0A0E9QZS0_ANGAN
MSDQSNSNCSVSFVQYYVTLYHRGTYHPSFNFPMPMYM